MQVVSETARSARPRAPWVWLSAVLLVAYPAFAESARPDADQPATIESDRAEMDRETGVAIYIGNAEFNQGSLRIQGDRIEVHTVDGELTYAEAEGGPARARQQTEEGDWIHAHGEKIIYEPEIPQVTLIRRARLTRDRDVFTAAFIQYRPDTGWVQAERDDDERVYITIQPDRDDDAEQE